MIPRRPGVESRTDVHLPTLLRDRLLQRLDALEPGSLVLMVAGAGTGKTTLLEQWSAWSALVVRVVRVDAGRDAFARFRTDLGTAVADVDPSARPQIDAALRSAAGPELLEAILGIVAAAPFTLAVDDADLLQSPESVAFLRALAQEWPDTSSLVLAGRTRPAVGLVRQHLRQPVHLLSERDLAFDESELTELLDRQGLPPALVTDILEWTGGWPAGVRLTLANPTFPRTDMPFQRADAGERSAGRSADRSAGAVAPVPPDDAELLSMLTPNDLSPDEIEFLEVVALLAPTTTQIIDAVLNRNDTHSILQAVQRRGFALVELTTETPTEIVIHNLLASALRDRLERDDPARAVAIRERAVQVLVSTGRFERAVRLLEEVGDLDTVADILYVNMTLLLYKRQMGRLAALVRRFSLDQVRARPALAIVAAHTVEPRDEALFRAMTERVAHDTTTILPGGDTPAMTVRRVMMAFGFIPVDRSDNGPSANEWTLARLAAEATEECLSDRPEEAIRRLEEMVSYAPLSAFTEATRLGVLAIAKAESGRLAEAATHVEEADHILERAKLTDSTLSSIVDTAAVVVGRRQGHDVEARLHIARHKMATGGDGKKLWHARGLLEVASVSLARGEPPAVAAAAIAQIQDLVRPWSGLHGVNRLLRVLVKQIEDAEARHRAAPSSLTTAERRILSYLPSHYSIPRIAAELRIAQSTAKTQCLAVYRKLGVNGREEAVRQAESLGLLDATG